MPQLKKVRGGREKARRFRRECKSEMMTLALDLRECCLIHHKQITIVWNNVQKHQEEMASFTIITKRLKAAIDALTVVQSNVDAVRTEVGKFPIFHQQPDMDDKMMKITNRLLELGSALSEGVHAEIQDAVTIAAQESKSFFNSIAYEEIQNLDKQINAALQTGPSSDDLIADILRNE